nr:hypothetical protein [uncultured Undibacterium sp.]
MLNSTKIQAGAYMSGYFDLSIDSWYKTDSKKLSPLLMLGVKLPQQIFFHTKNDEMCVSQGTSEMARKLQALNIQHELVNFDQGGNFFVLPSPDAREQIKKSLTGFIQRLSWID